MDRVRCLNMRMEDFSYDELPSPEHEVEGSKFINPEDVLSPPKDIETAKQFLLNNGYGNDSNEDFSIGVDLVANMLTLAEQTLSDAPLGWRFAQDLGAPDGRCIVLLSQKHEAGISRDLKVVDSLDNSEEMFTAFIQDQS